MDRRNIIAACIGAVALVAVTASASALITREKLSEDAPVQKTVSTVHQERVVKTAPREARNNPPVTQPQATQNPPPPACDDGNIAGTVLGGAAGGVIGSQIGNGSGQTAATIAGVAGGALLGREFIPTHNVTCAQ